jgi:hypothetical protein
MAMHEDSIFIHSLFRKLIGENSFPSSLASRREEPEGRSEARASKEEKDIVIYPGRIKAPPGASARSTLLIC